MVKTVVVDAGNYATKYAYKNEGKIEVDTFSSVTDTWAEIDFGMINAPITSVFFGSRKSFIGEGVKLFYKGKESRMFKGNIGKGHVDTLIRTITALHRMFKNTGENEFNLVLTCPFAEIEEDKQYFTDNLMGTHTATVDGEEFVFTVKNIVVMPEGLGAISFIDSVVKENCIVVDAGSKTVNILYIFLGGLNKTKSTTFEGGTVDKSMEEIVEEVERIMGTTTREIPIVCTGGRAEELALTFKSNTRQKIIVLPDTKKYEKFYTNAVGILAFENTYEKVFAKESVVANG